MNFETKPFLIRTIMFSFLLFLFIPKLLLAQDDITLPSEVLAKAFILRAENKNLWEKTLIIKFSEKRRVLSTLDGFLEVLAVVNHSAHPEIWKEVCETKKTKQEVGGKVYLRVVVALVTAGAKTNALRTGVDEGKYIEGEEPKGTVNIIILTNARLTDGAMARAIITATEAKTAAFQDLNVPSSYTKGVQATGTGTDNIIVVSGTTGPKVNYTGGHSKIGELIGKAVYEAVVYALEKQNGFKKIK
jgi:adenosylcobinamide amidohydrolase